MPSAGNEGKTKLSETEVITTVKEIRLQPQGFEMTENSPIIPLGIRDGGTVVCVEVLQVFRFFLTGCFSTIPHAFGREDA